MADQTQRLEIATVKAEVGSNILYRFANDAAEAAAIPTDSGDIQNLKQVVAEIQEDAAQKISIATTIYPTAAAGLAASAEGGIFLVQSSDADEIYTVWQKVSGAAVNTGKTAMSSQAVQDALTASNEAAQAAENAADIATSRTAGFLAPAATEPTVRDDGMPLQIGDRYINTTSQTEYLFKSEGWVANDSLAAIDDLRNGTDPEKGATEVGFDGGTVADVLVDAKSIATYADLRGYTGRATTVQILNGARSGRFRRLGNVSGYADDGAVTIISSLGVVWQRINTDVVQFGWWEIDGLSDMSAQLAAALALNKPVQLPGGTIYAAVSIPTGTVLRGQGKSKTLIKPPPGNTSNAININGVNNVHLSDFKLQGSATAKEGESVGLIHCSNGFYNVHLDNLEVIQGSQCGIVMVGGADNNERSSITNCPIYSNRFDGIQICETKHVDIENNQIHHNSHHGIALQPSVWPPVAYSVEDILIARNRVFSNIGHGIYVTPLIMGGTGFGNFTYSFTNQQYCKDIRVVDNRAYSNSASGIMAGGYSCVYTSNVCTNNGTSGDGYSGIVVAGFSLTVNGNTCTGNSTYGIDIGGSAHCSVTGNNSSYNGVGKSFCVGINVGASVFCTVESNTCAYNGSNDTGTYQILVAGWDGDGVYSYELQGGYNVISGNTVRGFFNCFGIYLRRSAMYNQVNQNYIGQTSRVTSIINEVDFSQSSNVIKGNVHDISTVAGGVTLASAAALVIDDFNEEFIVTGTTNITSIVTKSSNDNAGKIVALKITAAGSGYTSKPTVTITGGGGTGATATAEIGRSGVLLGIKITNGGSGYTSNPTITIGSDGGGTGGAATAVFGLKNNAGRRITLQFEGALTVSVSGMNATYTAAGGSTLTLEGRKNGNGQWVEIARSQ